MPSQRDASADRSLIDNTPNSNRTRRKQRNPRSPTSCEPCRSSKLRCDRKAPCGNCSRRNNATGCTYSSKRDGKSTSSRLGQGSAPATLQSNTETRAQEYDRAGVNSNPNGNSPGNGEDYTQARWDALYQRPLQDKEKLALTATPAASSSLSLPRNTSAAELKSLLPPSDCCDYLIIQYFTFIAPMFHVLLEDSFQRRYATFSRDTHDDMSWLALLFAICSISVQTLTDNDPLLATIGERLQCATPTQLAKEFRTLAMACLSADNFMFHYGLDTLEALLLVTYGICHDSGVEAAWTLLGMALNMGIALKRSNCTQAVDTDRWQRCWIGILSLHTYQALLFRDVDLKSLLKTSPFQSRTQTENHTPTMGSLIMDIKIRLLKIASRICNGESELPADTVNALDAEISRESEVWSAHFLQNGNPSMLDTISYAHWCMFEIYAHQLYLHLHRPLCRPGAARYRPFSKWRCTTSGSALLEFNQKYLELPRLRHHRWTMFGMNATATVHGALALASCLLARDEDTTDSTPYRVVFDAAVNRIGNQQQRSPIYEKAYPILRHIQTILSPRTDQRSATQLDFGASFDNWMDTIQLFDTTSINWDYWDDIVMMDPDQNQAGDLGLAIPISS